jgi:transcriptional regulator with XRE-family HTH domain
VSPFAEKLDLALKALSMSRGRLAAALGVNKSVVSRWASGAATPSALNLEALTNLIASRQPGFTLLDWDRDLPALAQLFGVEPATPPVVAQPASVLDALFAPVLDSARQTIPQRTAPYEGFWRSIQPAPGKPTRFICLYGLIRRADSGLMEFRGGCAGLLFNGWLLPAEGKLFAIVLDYWGHTPIMMVLNTVSLPRATRLDGLCLTTLMDSNRTPIATPVVFERLGDLSGDREADDRTFEEELKVRKPFPDPEEISAEVRAHLVRDFGPAAATTGGEMLMMSTLADSMSAGVMAAPA